MNWLLIVTLVILLGGAFLGWRAGFVKTVFSLISTIAVIIITLLVSPITTSILTNIEAVPNAIRTGLEAVIDFSGLLEGAEEDEMDTLDGGLSMVDGLSLPDSLKETVKDALEKTVAENSVQAQAYAGEKLDAFETYICDVLTEMILNAIGFIVTFLVATIGIAALCFVLDIISKLPVLHQINTLAGAGVGALEGLVILWIFFIVITMLGSTAFGQGALQMISESKLLSFLYDSNVLSKIVTGKL